jgi:hypothetical protein
MADRDPTLARAGITPPPKGQDTSTGMPTPGVTAAVKDLTTGQVQKVGLTVPQFHEYLRGVPGQFDNLMDNHAGQVIQKLAQSPGRPVQPPTNNTINAPGGGQVKMYGLPGTVRVGQPQGGGEKLQPLRSGPVPASPDARPRNDDPDAGTSPELRPDRVFIGADGKQYIRGGGNHFDSSGKQIPPGVITPYTPPAPSQGPQPSTGTNPDGTSYTMTPPREDNQGGAQPRTLRVIKYGQGQDFNRDTGQPIPQFNTDQLTKFHEQELKNQGQIATWGVRGQNTADIARQKIAQSNLNNWRTNATRIQTQQLSDFSKQINAKIGALGNGYLHSDEGLQEIQQMARRLGMDPNALLEHLQPTGQSQGAQVQGGGQQAQPQQTDILYLKAHPESRGGFDAHFGQGASARILGQ